MRTPHIATRPAILPPRVDSQASSVPTRTAAARSSLAPPAIPIEQEYTPSVVLASDLAQLVDSSSGTALEVTRDADGVLRFYSV